MTETIEKIRSQIIQDLSKIIELQNKIRQSELEKEDIIKDLCLGIIDVIDSLENKINNVLEKKLSDYEFNKSVQTFKIIQKKLLQLLQKYGVTQVHFPNNKLITGFSKVIGVEPDITKENDTIVSIVKNGYNRGNKVIREAELIVIKN
ncbi:MAG: nucleotide exchange factor GrpE [Ignavibacteria bacterium]|nr:nucleotide exchange factor GrpE [Ignavibacteria bacterium]